MSGSPEVLKTHICNKKVTKIFGGLQLICYLCNVQQGHELFYIMKTNQFVRRLKAAGCSLVRHGGEHDIWYSPLTGLTERVPRHGSKEIHNGLLKSLEKRLLGL